MMTIIWQTWNSLCQVTVLDQNCDLSICFHYWLVCAETARNNAMISLTTTIRDDLKGLSENSGEDPEAAAAGRGWRVEPRRAEQSGDETQTWLMWSWRDFAEPRCHTSTKSIVQVVETLDAHDSQRHLPVQQGSDWLSRGSQRDFFFFFLKMCLMRRLVSHTTLR